MIKANPNTFRKHFYLTAAGVTLQMLGSICLLAAALGATKEINKQIKQVLIQELSK